MPVTIAHDGKESTPSHSVQAISTDALGTDSPYVIATGTFRFSPLATSGAGDTVSRIGTRIHRLASNAA
ncbi:putative ferredoxin--NADP reductase [Burkholderia pseudomallei MSHR4377]|nr:putative ferredoxin--NADP reductase [Burkholderia pseudomallei MSHR4377]KGV63526.1 putative ferredoxin--NADP reductase [Burkholderia pseudomallei MSHR4003]